MHITSYQMQNVLKVYSNHLSKTKAEKSSQPTIRKPNSDRVRISAEGKRKNLIDKVAADIVARITNEGVGDDDAPFIRSPMDDTPSNTRSPFEFNVIHGSADKEKNRLSLENAGFLIRRIEELTGGPDGHETDAVSPLTDGSRPAAADEVN